jgi:hypothetical protein
LYFLDLRHTSLGSAASKSEIKSFSVSGVELSSRTFGRRVVMSLAVLVVAWAAVSFATIDRAVPPGRPPRGYDRKALVDDPVIRVQVAYDQHLASRHGVMLEWFVREALAIHTAEWRQYRGERFALGSMRLADSGKERDALYVLTRFLMESAESPQTIHVSLIGRPLEVYRKGSGRTPVSGLAFRGSDTVLISVVERVSAQALAYSLFHEIGHLWETHDLPFAGGHSTFGSKSGGYSFVVDAGNVEILQASRGPVPRVTPNRAPAVIGKKLDRARRLTDDAAVRRQLVDIVMHEPSLANQSYVRKKKALLLASRGKNRARVREFLQELERTSNHPPHDASIRQQIADHYWRANDLIARRQYNAAEREILAIQAIDVDDDLHLLVGAMEKRIRRR